MSLYFTTTDSDQCSGYHPGHFTSVALSTHWLQTLDNFRICPDAV